VPDLCQFYISTLSLYISRLSLTPRPTMARSHASPSHSPREKHAERSDRHSDSSRKSHHVRRKSSGPRDEKKRPSLSRKTTPQHVKTTSGRRDRDRDRDDDAGRDRDRDGGESFPQFWYALNLSFFPFLSPAVLLRILIFAFVPSWRCLDLISLLFPVDLHTPTGTYSIHNCKTIKENDRNC
jgi:hypothetical protein